MINTKITKTTAQQTNEERLFKLLESMDWKLWEMYNMMKDFTSDKTSSKKATEETKEEPKSKLKQAVTKSPTKKDAA